MRRLIPLLCSLLICLPLQAAEVIFSAASDSDSLRAFMQALARQRTQDRFEFRTPTQLQQNLPASDARLVVLDPETLDWRLRQSSMPATLVIRISRLEASRLLAGRPHPGVTLLWSDPPPHRQVQLARLLLPNSKRLGLLYDQESAFLLEDYRQAADALGLELQARQWDPQGSRRPLLALLASTDLLLGIDAPRLYNADTIKSLLLTSYARNRALLGPTAGFVRAGSLASTFSDQQDWLDELNDWLDRPASQWPPSAYPAHFKVVSNRQVARALGIAIDDDEALTRQLAAGETR